MTEEKELPQVEEPAKQEAEAIDVDGLMAQLEKAGVTNAEDLDGKLTAGAQAGRLAQLLGDERKRSEELTEKLAQQLRPQPPQDYMDYGEGQTINIEDAIHRNVRSAIAEEKKAEREEQHRAYQKRLSTYNKVVNHPSYKSGFIKDEVDAKLKDPNYNYMVEVGEIDPMEDFHNMLDRKHVMLHSESSKTIEQLAGGAKVQPPHVETGERNPSNLVSEQPAGTDAAKRLEALKEKTSKGVALTQDEELQMMDDILGPSQL